MNRFYPVCLFLTAGISVAGLVGFGCASQDEKPRTDKSGRQQPAWTEQDAINFDAALVDTHQDDSIANGIVTQHTIYPYHFVPDSATLNELGQRDVAILARHYAALSPERGVPPAMMSIRRGDAPPALYDARVRAVTAELARGGVPSDRVRLSDATPGGDGMLPGKIKVILQRDMENKSYYNYQNGSIETGISTSGGSSGGGNGGNSQ